MSTGDVTEGGAPPAPPGEHTQTPRQKVIARMRRVLARAQRQGDPWHEFNILENTTERVVKYTYDPISQQWAQGVALVKMQREPFAAGAMRECFRLKKHTQQPNRPLRIDWSKSSNYVAKRYKQPVRRELYFEDVKLQMDAQYWCVI